MMEQQRAWLYCVCRQIRTLTDRIMSVVQVVSVEDCGAMSEVKILNVLVLSWRCGWSGLSLLASPCVACEYSYPVFLLLTLALCLTSFGLSVQNQRNDSVVSVAATLGKYFHV